MRYSTLLALPFAFFSVVAFAQTPAIQTPASQSTNIYQDTPSLPVARNGEMIDSVGSGAIDAILPVVEITDKISYITGGVGDEELAALKEQEQNFNVRLLIKSAKGEYMSEALVRFLDPKNEEVLRVEDAGPYLYANLPVGAYTVEVTSLSGVVKKTKIKASNKPIGRTYITF